jgi:hypothetical protein
MLKANKIAIRTIRSMSIGTLMNNPPTMAKKGGNTKIADFGISVLAEFKLKFQDGMRLKIKRTRVGKLSVIVKGIADRGCRKPTR